MNCKKRKGNHKFGFGGMMEMEDIKRVQLSEIVELITKGTTPTTLGYEFQDEGVNFFKIECFDENGGFIESKVAHISEECHKKMKRSQLKNGDILFSIAGAIGRVAIVTEEMLPANINQALAIIRISDEQVYLPYIKLILTSPIVIEQFERKKQGVAQLNLSLKDINEISIPLPGKDKQIELAELFDKVVGVISKRNKELSVLDDIIKARFVEMFGYPIINSFGIDTKSMTDVCEIIDGDRGKNYPTADEFSDEGYCLFLNAKNVTSTGFNFATCMFVTKEKDEVLRKGKLSRGDVVLTTRGTLGNLAFYTEDIPFEHVRINSGMVILRMKQDVVDEVYFIEQFKMQLADIREKIASGSAQPQLPISAMNKINILTPNIEKQRQFADFVRKVDKSKVAVQKALDETQLLFDSLMQKYFG